MSGRRSHPRIVFSNASGMLRESRDVLVSRVSESSYVALSTDPCFPGDALTMETVGGHSYETTPVTVLASRPIVVDGAVRYEVQLKREP